MEIASECNNHIKSSHQIKGLSWSMIPATNSLCRVVSNTWSPAAWDQHKKFFHFLAGLWPCGPVGLLWSCALSPSHKPSASEMCEQKGQSKRQLCAVCSWCPSTFSPKSFSLTSISTLLRARESWQERVALSSVALIFPVALYPRHQGVPVQSGCSSALSVGLCTSSWPFPWVFPSFSILKWVLMPAPLWHPVAGESWWLQPALTYRTLLKPCSIILLIRGTGESKTA